MRGADAAQNADPPHKFSPRYFHFTRSARTMLKLPTDSDVRSVVQASDRQAYETNYGHSRRYAVGVCESPAAVTLSTPE
jgi:hypothetical protein